LKSYLPGRFSPYLRPISFSLDVLTLILFGELILSNFNQNAIWFSVATIVIWSIISSITKFYEVYRFTKEITILTLLIKQLFFYSLVVLAFTGLQIIPNIVKRDLFNYIAISFLIIAISKFGIYFLLKTYRAIYGGNRRKVVVFGENVKTRALVDFFNNKKEYGYNLIKIFNTKEKDFDLKDSLEDINKHNADEIYCSMADLNTNEIKTIVNFADNNLKIVKFLPDNKGNFLKRVKYQYYDYLPVMSFREIPLEDSFNVFVKRVFDVVFSLIIIFFILSWLTPILAVLIRLESKGPVFFKQSRNGFNYKEFECYKFRSMTPNPKAHLEQVTRGDQRITRIGKFIRKTSIDELPQFFNVLFGDMSVVGPRPHMVSHTEMYAKRIDKFMVRHFVKPGITGLAQTSGFRGEVETDKDIIGRVKYDIFYIENWSLILDLKIILKTFLNAIKGEEKAY
jgi:putative colanic acid biosynthesis UDP-glucose lipid carrier transferase